MSLAIRMTLILTLILATLGLAAQEAPLPTETPEEASTSIEVTTEPSTALSAQNELSNQEVREQFTSLLLDHPRHVATILALDPTLLHNEAFLAKYPEIGRFVDTHPEIVRNPSYFVGQFSSRAHNSSLLGDILEPIIILAVFVLIAFALAWLVRTIIEQKRWNRLSQTQSEVHNKILDRFGTSNELLDYVKTPAGAKFLESAPIPLHSEQPVQNAPLSRILLSIQLGVVIAAGSVGMLLVSGRLPEQSGEELFAFGLIAFCVGAGFIGSAFVSLYLSQRLGLWEPRPSRHEPSIDPGTVR